MTIILEVAVGLAFVYLLFSLLASAINEAVLGHLAQLRARVLEESLRALLSNEQSRSSLLHILKTIGAIFGRITTFFWQPKTPLSLKAGNFAESVLSHPLVRGLTSNGRSCPSYLPAETFADAVVGSLVEFSKRSSAAGQAARTFKDLSADDLVAGLNQLNDLHAQQLLNSVLAECKTIAEARERLTLWFNNSMDRVTGLYRRYTQFWLYVWATLIVVWLNVDSIEIGKRLFTDAEFRGVLVARATEFVSDTNNIVLFVASTNSQATTAAMTNRTAVSAAKLQMEIEQLKLPLGWGACGDVAASNSVPGWIVSHFPRLIEKESITNTPTLLVSGVLSGTAPCPGNASEWWLKILGLIITIAAISQGAPFWFDLLNRFTNLRAVGKPPVVEKPALPGKSSKSGV